MANPKYVYELLMDHCACDAVVDNLMIGLVWTLCQTKDRSSTGLAMSPGFATRTLSWSGSLTGKPVTDIAQWIYDWDPFHATVAMAAINSCINSRPLPDSKIVEHDGEHPNLAVFEHFLPLLKHKNVVVIGHYPGIERYQNHMQLSVLEKQPSADDLPDSACEFLLPNADWVFLTASSIPNKTFPRLVELASSAKTVLMGPTTPWLPQLHEFGIDYLAGVEVVDRESLFHTAAQGGGVKIFNRGLRYRIAELSPTTSMTWLKHQIAGCAAERTQLNRDMETWYEGGNSERFPYYSHLEQVNTRLSRMDTSYKDLWDRYGSLAKGIT
ncbi:MAG: Rossmann-like domain-containing protein [Gammaproteobacteria bacterium]